MVGHLISLFLGLMLGWILPRVASLVMTRRKALNRRFPEHPRPIPISPFLIQRLVSMNRLWWSSVPVGILIGGIAMLLLISSRSAFGYGLFIASFWTSSTRLFGLSPCPWNFHVIDQINGLIEPSNSCCDEADAVWGIEAVRCSSCELVLLALPRPDLGRPRSDGLIQGLARVLWMDGSAMPSLVDESQSRTK